MNNAYAGIGARKTPDGMLLLFTSIAKRLEGRGYTLRSGGAPGADSAFERGVLCGDNQEIFLPWKGFNNNPSKQWFISEDAYQMAAEFHPRWAACSPAARKFHARNCYQVLGFTLIDPVDFIVCWTPGGKVAGGTGQALRIAQAHNIPVVNFGREDLLCSPMEELRKLVVGEGV